VGKDADLWVAMIMEYIAAEILDVAG